MLLSLQKINTFDPNLTTDNLSLHLELMNDKTKMPTKEQKPRILSLDTLRGFDMFWIIGGGTLIEVLAKCFPAAWLQVLSRQMEHATWAGFHFEDLIFPLFMFISGVTIPIAVISKLEKGSSKKEVILKIAKRMLILIALGIIFNGTLRNGFSNARYVSILGQIGISYFIASLIVIYAKSLKNQLFWLCGLLIGYSVVQLLIPVPGIGSGILTPYGCINSYIDRMLLPGRLAYGPDGEMVSGNGVFDALGILSIISAIGVTLMGYFAGIILLQKDSTPQKKLRILVGIGIGLIVLSLFISPFYPVIKKCWTTTYNILSGGISFLLVALFYFVIDVLGYKKWTLFFRVIGTNSIFIYLIVVGNLLNISSTTTSLFGWIINPMSENAGQLVLVIGNITLAWLLLYLMYRKSIFIKV
jgi:predicted acyltransferase